MSVQTKKDGRHFVVHYNTGKQIWEPFGRGDRALQAAKCRDLELQLQKIRGDARPGMPSIPFQALSQRYIEARVSDLSGKTRHEILSFLSRYVLDPLGQKPIGDIRMHDWTEIQNRMIAAGAGNRSINTYFRYLNKIWRWAVEQGYVQTNPWTGRTPLKQKKYNIDLVTLEELRRILAAATPHLAWAIRVCYHTGARPGPSELYALRWEDVDQPNGRIRIPGTKTPGSHRWQYLPGYFMAELKARYEASRENKETSPYIVTFQDRAVASLKVSWGEALRAAGITRNVRMYDIRHFYITHALAGGAAIMDLAERAGHTDATMVVKVYSHMVEELRSKRPFVLPDLAEAEPTDPEWAVWESVPPT
jgi:integrase